ncbi:V-type ATP synthase subunit A [Parasphaerochaeta coccoides]|uniref:V-type ATP synthase alpha chain n=1 Tax=Parasphaerochaeta coccoides (strain ATCC BAA-1237 / DSM 17374 / SPN1) TaxID=760011 RepID=F4GLL2_PARC1|nr:V-type ATP synthase subunit A [Parasphaerochaeta coccoides]AEC01982.1 V-type ATP synthase alpha chain [Parasphaerochaeta coccoides DSM 17374]
MQNRIVGQVKRVNGPVITAKNITDAMMMELVYIGEQQLIGEVVKLSDATATIQVYEDATGVAPGDNIYGSGMPLSVELGPGLIGTIYDGIQRPLEALKDISGDFIARGVDCPALDRNRSWHFVPIVHEGDTLRTGQVLGHVQENDNILHKILLPARHARTGDDAVREDAVVVTLMPEGDYAVTDIIAIVTYPDGKTAHISLMQRWPIRTPRPTERRMALDTPLLTGQRVIDVLFPLAKGGTVAIPGGFGTGKTMTQHAIASWCDADIIVYIGCGERGNEMTDVLREFPHIVDPRTGRSLMERTILIANTSNMPVSAREASIYTGITMAEYYRDQGYAVALMADSTSRWAEALRELSGRMEEMPAEEGFPAYLPTRIAEFYERAGRMQTFCGKEGSISIIGAVSPPGGDFSEPVTQHTRRFVRCFWGLDRALASARHYPAISWTESYSEYVDEVISWWNEHCEGQWGTARGVIMDLLQKEVRLQQIVKLVGSDALPDSQNFIIEVCSLFKTGFLQQNAFDDIDKYCSTLKQSAMLRIIVRYWELGSAAISKGVPLVKLRRLKAVQDIAKMRFTIGNDDEAAMDRLEVSLERSIQQLGGMYEEDV